MADVEDLTAKEIFAAAKNVSDEQFLLVAKSVLSGTFHRKGQRVSALCPFHRDKHEGNFMLNVSKRSWRCYSCGESGTLIDLVMKIKGVSAIEAAKYILTCTGKDVSAAQVIPPKKKAERPAADPDRLDKVYRAFAAAAPALTLPEFKALKEVRKVRNLDGYFHMPADEDGRFWTRFRALIGKTPLDGVPGFYYRDGKWHFFSAKNAIGFLNKDRLGRATGITLRLNSPRKGMGRYRYLSSGFAEGEGRGTSCGVLEDVVWPDVWCGRAIAITEGHFKAEALARIGFLAINMQGISTWQHAATVARELAAEYAAKRFVLCYDQEDNQATKDSAMSMVADLLKTGLPVDIAEWPGKFGKGIDDVINNGHIGCIKRRTYA